MDTARISQLSSVFGSRISRRSTLKYTGLGLGAAGLGAHAFSSSAAAQSATPAGTTKMPESLGLPEGERTYFMFVQAARSGTWVPKEGEDGVYTLTLNGLPAQTVYFSDRPERIVGMQTTTEFLKALGFSANNPPNAAVVTENNGDQDVLVIELFNPVYTEGTDGATLVYDARILANFTDTRLGNVALEANDKSIPASFDGAALFIDDCADGTVACYGSDGVVDVHYGCCYHFPSCYACWDLSNVCSSVPGCENGCEENFTVGCLL